MENKTNRVAQETHQAFHSAFTQLCTDLFAIVIPPKANTREEEGGWKPRSGQAMPAVQNESDLRWRTRQIE